jgi:two-component system chemotaxis response regulator CheY
MKAIIVDDSRSMRLILSAWLRETGFEAVEAADGRDAMALLTTSGPLDLAIVDWNMPVMTGFEMVIQVRADTRFNLMPILCISTETSEEQKQLMLSVGANAYIAKPVTEEAFREKLQSLGLI